MAYKRINRVKNKFVISLILCLVVGIGIYSIWSYKMNYEMIMRYTDLDENAPDFPFGQKKVDARYWILEKNFSKIDNFRIYNPKIIKLDIDENLKTCITDLIKKKSSVYPALFEKIKKNKIFINFESEISTIYLFSIFDEKTNMPNKDYFLVNFDNYEITVSRQNLNSKKEIYCSDLDKIDQYIISNPELFKKLKSINPRFPEYLNR
ncbi:hypothetical protein ACG9Y7_11355 [Acinetobacter gerneri]|uniref:hypothetical protein n=1 Tax=Acinetobacter gerneri TaxID=202952 RepID=UPI003AF46FD4